MRWFFIAVAAVVGIIVAIFAAGSALPVQHVASRAIKSGRSPEAVWQVITDHGSEPKWRTDLTGIERLPDKNGHAVWREHYKNGDAMTIETTESLSPSRLVRVIADVDSPFTGRWEIEITPGAAGSGSIVKITETGEVANPIFRFISAFVMGHTATMEKYLKDLAGRLGEKPEFVSQVNGSPASRIGNTVQAAPSARQEPVAADVNQTLAIFLFDPIRKNEGSEYPATMDVVVLWNGSDFIKPPDPNEPEEKNAEELSFEQKYYQANAEYPLLSGGARVGSVKVIQRTEISCVSIAAAVKAETAKSFGPNEHGIVIAGENAPLRESSLRREPSTEERERALSAVRKIFQSKGVPSDAISHIEIQQLLATQLTPGGNILFFAEATAHDAAVNHWLLVALRQSGSQLIPSIIHYSRQDDNKSETSGESESYSDQFDFDRDGTDEIITMVTGYESWIYAIYRLVDGKFEQIYTGGGGGC